jgi:hypothetical protein
MEIYEEKLRLLRRFKPHFFDAQGNLRSRRKIQSHLHNQSSASFNKKLTKIFTFDLFYLII